MPSRRAESGEKRRKHSLGNLRRAHPASGATWNVQVVRGKMSSKCLWHACRALVLGLSLMLLGAGMATIGYYADHLSINTELRGNSTIRIKNDLKGFHLNNFAYVGPIVMGFGGFIVVASCVMTFEARDSAAKVVPARLRAGTTTKSTIRSQGSSASQRKGLQTFSRWEHQFGVFRSSPANAPLLPPPFDRDALTADLKQFSKALSASARFSPKLRYLTYSGSVPELSTSTQSTHPLAYSTNMSHLLSPKFKPLDGKCFSYNYQHHRPHLQQHQFTSASCSKPFRHHHHHRHRSSGRPVKTRSSQKEAHIRTITPENSVCTLLQPPSNCNIYWKASSFDEGFRAPRPQKRGGEYYNNRRSDIAKRHVLARQKTIEHDEDQISPLRKRRDSTMSDSQYNSRQLPLRCSSMCLRTSSIDSRRIQVDLHSPELVPKSILRSPKRYSSGPSNTPSVEREFRSQLSVCSAPPVPMHELSGQSSIEPCVPEESIDFNEDQTTTEQTTTTITSEKKVVPPIEVAIPIENPLENTTNNIKGRDVGALNSPFRRSSLKKPRPDSLAVKNTDVAVLYVSSSEHELSSNQQIQLKSLQHSNFSRSFCLPKNAIRKHNDDDIFFINSTENTTLDSSDAYDSFRVINERRRTLLRAESDTALGEHNKDSFKGMQNIPENTVDSRTFDIAKDILP